MNEYHLKEWPSSRTSDFVFATLANFFDTFERQMLIATLPEQRGVATGTDFIGFDAGIVIGSILLRIVCQYWDFGAIWLLATAGTLLGLAGLLADRRHSPSVSPH